MSNDVTPPLAPPVTAPTWEASATHAMKDVSTFLRSQRKSLIISHDLTAGLGFPTSAPVKYTRDQVTAFVVDVLELCADRKDCDTMPDPASMGNAALAKHLSATKTHAGKTLPISVRQLKQFRRALKTAYKAGRLADATSAGTNWFADGVTDKNGEPRSFVSRRKAVSAWIRTNNPLAGEWHTGADAGSWKTNALSFVRQGAVDASTAQDARDAADALRPAPVAPAPVAAVKSAPAKVSKADLVKQAVALGLPAAAAKSMNMVRLTATIGALRNL
jgi:hypothetical protein